MKTARVKMKKAFAVIGANFGDEGKGLITDYLTRSHNYAPTVVARCNGGAQAGHTVVTANGERHVFGHVSSGTFAGAETYLSKNFILNPYVLKKELDQLGWQNRIGQAIFAHPECRITTIYDMALNALRELTRGSNRHGSCGLGINETVTRDSSGFTFRLRDINSANALRQLQNIYERWWQPQLNELLSDPILGSKSAEIYRKILHTPIAHLEDFAPLFKLKNVMGRDNTNDEVLIVEGAQGLMLDEFLGQFPHVTRSVTGLASSIVAAAELGHTDITPYYVTRAYLTRHGAGPLEGEGLQITDIEIPVDQTNVTGEWQGHFRYAPINLTSLRDFIDKDLQRAEAVAQVHGVKILQPKIAVTCMDHIGSWAKVGWYGNYEHQVNKEDFIDNLQVSVCLKVAFISEGPTAEDVRSL